MQVIIPAAGYATRLYPLTENKPKALLKVKGKPILSHIVRRVEELPGIDGIFIASNAKYHSSFEKWLKSFKSKIPIRILNDGTKSNEDRLGQIGDIQLAIEKFGLGQDLLVIAGDNLFNFSLLPAHGFFEKKRAIVNALWDSKSLEVAKQQGIAVVGAGGKFVEFQEKDENPKSTLTSLGIYFFPKEQVGLFRRFIEGGNNVDKMGYFMIWLIENSAVYGFTYAEKWFDIGWHSALKQARKEFLP
jgi:glucose-1-phosphate thymidylyltransferase